MHVSSDDCMVFTNARANQVAFLYPYLQHFSSDCPIASDGHLVFLFGIGCTLLQFPVAVDPPTPFLMLMDESTPLPTSVLIVWMTAYFVEKSPAWRGLDAAFPSHTRASSLGKLDTTEPARADSDNREPGVRDCGPEHPLLSASSPPWQVGPATLIRIT